MELLDRYNALRAEVFAYFGYAEVWRVLPLDDAREYFWQLDGEGPGVVRFAKTEQELESEDGDYYENEIYTQRHLPKWVYRGADKWDHKDEWHRHGKDFLVVVKRHAVGPSSFDPYEGPHRWAVYAYVYPKHRLFGNFHGPAMWQPAAAALPLHGGPSLLRWHYDDDGKPTSVQIGADYHHLHDTHFSSYATADDAYEVFADAEQLFDHLAETVNTPAVCAP